MLINSVQLSQNYVKVTTKMICEMGLTWALPISEPLCSSPPKRRTRSRVHFPLEPSHLVTMVVFDDDVESQDMRVCYWEIFARDRARFRDRIEQASEVLNSVLDPAHRAKVFDRLSARQQRSDSPQPMECSGSESSDEAVLSDSDMKLEYTPKSEPVPCSSESQQDFEKPPSIPSAPNIQVSSV